MKDINNNSIDQAVNATLKFFVDIILESNVTPSFFLKRMNDRLIEKGEDPKPIQTISDSDIELFKKSFLNLIGKQCENGNNVHLVVDYKPWFLLQNIIEESGIEDTESFIFRARFPTKMKIDIKHNIVNLSIDAQEYPVIYISDELLNVETEK